MSASFDAIAPAPYDPVLQSTSLDALTSPPSDAPASPQPSDIAPPPQIEPTAPAPSVASEVPPNELVAKMQELTAWAESAIAVSQLLQVPRDGLSALVRESS